MLIINGILTLLKMNKNKSGLIILGYDKGRNGSLPCSIVINNYFQRFINENL